jgi:multidrug efflux system membrane fusion protein
VTVAKSEQEKARLGLLDAQLKLEAAEADLEAGQRDQEAILAQIRLYSLPAPITGTLGKIDVALGQTLAVGTKVTDVVNVADSIDVLCYVAPRIAARLQKGQTARLGGIGDPTSEGKSGPPGKVEYIAAQAEMDTGNFAVKVRFPNQALKLRANTTVRIRVATTPGTACLTLPESAVFEDQDPPAVIVVEDLKTQTKEGKEIEVGKARKLQAKLGIRDRILKRIQIISLTDPDKKWKGTLEEAKFVEKGGQGLRTGDQITLEQEEEEGE